MTDSLTRTNLPDEFSCAESSNILSESGDPNGHRHPASQPLPESLLWLPEFIGRDEMALDDLNDAFVLIQVLSIICPNAVDLAWYTTEAALKHPDLSKYNRTLLIESIQKSTSIELSREEIEEIQGENPLGTLISVALKLRDWSIKPANESIQSIVAAPMAELKPQPIIPTAPEYWDCEYEPSDVAFKSSLRWLFGFIKSGYLKSEHLKLTDEAKSQLLEMTDSINDSNSTIPSGIILSVLTFGALYHAACVLIFKQDVGADIPTFVGSGAQNIDYRILFLEALHSRGYLDFRPGLKDAVKDMMADRSPFYESIHCKIIENLILANLRSFSEEFVVAHLKDRFTSYNSTVFPYDVEDALLQWVNTCAYQLINEYKQSQPTPNNVSATHHPHSPSMMPLFLETWTELDNFCRDFRDGRGFNTIAIFYGMGGESIDPYKVYPRRRGTASTCSNGRQLTTNLTLAYRVANLAMFERACKGSQINVIIPWRPDELARAEGNVSRAASAKTKPENTEISTTAFRQCLQVFLVELFEACSQLPTRPVSQRTLKASKRNLKEVPVPSSKLSSRPDTALLPVAAEILSKSALLEAPLEHSNDNERLPTTTIQETVLSCEPANQCDLMPFQELSNEPEIIPAEQTYGLKVAVVDELNKPVDTVAFEISANLELKDPWQEMSADQVDSSVHKETILCDPALSVTNLKCPQSPAGPDIDSNSPERSTPVSLTLSCALFSQNQHSEEIKSPLQDESRTSTAETIEFLDNLLQEKAKDKDLEVKLPLVPSMNQRTTRQISVGEKKGRRGVKLPKIFTIPIKKKSVKMASNKQNNPKNQPRKRDEIQPDSTIEKDYKPCDHHTTQSTGASKSVPETPSDNDDHEFHAPPAIEYDFEEDADITRREEAAAFTFLHREFMIQSNNGDGNHEIFNSFSRKRGGRLVGNEHEFPAIRFSLHNFDFKNADFSDLEDNSGQEVDSPVPEYDVDALLDNQIELEEFLDDSFRSDMQEVILQTRENIEYQVPENENNTVKETADADPEIQSHNKSQGQSIALAHESEETPPNLAPNSNSTTKTILETNINGLIFIGEGGKEEMWRKTQLRARKLKKLSKRDRSIQAPKTITPIEQEDKNSTPKGRILNNGVATLEPIVNHRQISSHIEFEQLQHVERNGSVMSKRANSKLSNASSSNVLKLPPISGNGIDTNSTQHAAKTRTSSTPEETKKVKRRAGVAVKSNRKLIKNALEVCLAGTVNEKVKLEVLEDLAQSSATYFLILFRGLKNHAFKGLYSYDPHSNQAYKLYSTTGRSSPEKHGEIQIIDGTRCISSPPPPQQNKPTSAGTPSPNVIAQNDVLEYYKYDSGSRSFKALPTKSFGMSVHAVAVRSEFGRRVLSQK